MSSHLTREQKNIWKDEIEESRLSDFNELKKWLKTQNISHKEKANGIYFKNIFISNLLKVYFFGSKKGYQYNLQGIKERLSKET